MIKSPDNRNFKKGAFNIKLESQTITQSTLLIPNRFLEDFLAKTEYSGREIYLRQLLKKYGPLVLSGVFGKRDKTKLRFQNEEDNVVKKNFLPRNSDWTQLGILSDYLGLSKTAMFTMLLTLDIADWPVDDQGSSTDE